ncbi:hypothetical protein M409DRAFT_22803 [Zasmidium cellare ATCC 36951]|uniref:Uncharacterized protein n=1 Tax=Zasmidium cellare ATCC 36951 TaxID=1080233 RepID=A0A6A6CLY7_ZASCE|nr:uncharacterized protein M409DRAFT_22803 [Zasmidium cellare ATCC 36951]KAF2166749.1 hypothetical protein M409DRAFT_22803 [Zasmidium cellare ATCC 36951]
MSKPCPFLEKLPAELRDEIYLLAFTPDCDNGNGDGDDEEDLLYAEPPSKSIVLTCHKVYNEAKGIYKDAYRKYWSETKFKINEGSARQGDTAILFRELLLWTPEDVNHILKLCIFNVYPDSIKQMDVMEQRVCWKGSLHITGFDPTPAFVWLKKDTKGKICEGRFGSEEEMKEAMGAHTSEIPLTEQLCYMLQLRHPRTSSFVALNDDFRAATFYTFDCSTHSHPLRTSSILHCAARLRQNLITQDKITMAQSCLFFEKLPAEMRNTIYELAFTPAVLSNEAVHLPDSTPPSKSLLTTCRQMHSEAKGVYRRAYRNYWTNSNFYISSKAVREKHGLKPSFTDFIPWNSNDIDHISKLTVRADGAQPNMAESCRLFALPAEMRNTIYELFFTPPIDKGPVQLNEATPPSKAILMTCKQANAEANALYKTTYRDYWRKGDFVVTRYRRDEEPSDILSAFHPTDSTTSRT